MLSAELSPKMGLAGRVKNKYGEFPGGPVVKIQRHHCWGLIQSLVGELRF